MHVSVVLARLLVVTLPEVTVGGQSVVEKKVQRLPENIVRDRAGTSRAVTSELGVHIAFDCSLHSIPPSPFIIGVEGYQESSCEKHRIMGWVYLERVKQK